MRDIFISWGSPDRAVVRVLRERLKDLGLGVWEYEEAMGAGDAIQRKVIEAIGDAHMALVCLSDESASRPWMASEAAWIVGAYRKTIKHILLVQVGAFDLKNLPLPFANENLNVFDLTRDGKLDENLERLIADIYGKLGLDAPLVMPAALFAMTEGDSKQLLDTWRRMFEQPTQAGGAPAENRQPAPAGAAAPSQQWEESLARLWGLCRLVGMEDPPVLFNFLAGRYGKTPADLKPFNTDDNIIDAVNAIVREANKARRADKRHPIVLQWVSDYWMTRRPPPWVGDWQGFRDWWRRRDSLLVVDSISTYHPDIGARLADVPAARSTLLWLPPYTQHTAALEEALRFSAQKISTLGDEFSNLEKYLNRPVSFDAGTALALKVWLRRALFDVSPRLEAREDNLEYWDKEGYVGARSLSSYIGG